MPTLGVSEVTGSAVLKILYEGDGAVSQVLRENKLLNIFEKTKEDIEGGSTVRFPLALSNSEGLGARGEAEDLPDPDNTDYVYCDFPLIKLTGSIQITGEAWKKSEKKGKAAFVNLIMDEEERVADAFNRDVNGMLYRDGKGIRAVMNGAIAQGTNVTVTVYNSAASAIYQGCKWLKQGMHVDFIDPATGTVLETNVRIASVNALSNTFVAAQINSAAIATGAYIVRLGNYNREWTGLDGYCADSTGVASIQGIAVATYPTWAGAELTNGGTGRPQTFDLLEQLTKLSGQQNNKKPEIFCMGFVQHRKYAAQVTQTKQILVGPDTAGKVRGDIGYNELTFDNIPVLEDIDCQDDRVYALQYKSKSEGMKIWTLGWREWLTAPNNKNHIWYKLEGKDMYRADFCCYGQFGGKRRNIQAILLDLER